MTNQEYLKEHSRQHHQRTEDALDLRTLCQKKDSYIEVLKAFSGFYLIQEERLQSHVNELSSFGIDLNQKIKLPLLYDDLTHFGEKTLRLGPDLRAIDSLPAAMAVLYVLEGSTLGGQVIHTALFKAGIIDESGRGGRFFNPYGSVTMKNWNEFKQLLNAVSSEHREVMLDYTRSTFEALEHWLRQHLKR